MPHFYLTPKQDDFNKIPEDLFTEMTELKRRAAYLSAYNFGWQTAVYRLSLGANVKH